MLQHHTTDDDVICVVEAVLNDVSLDELPPEMAVYLAVVVDQRRDDVDACVVDVIPRAQEARHPRHVATRHVQQTDSRQPAHGPYLGHDAVKCCRDLLCI